MQTGLLQIGTLALNETNIIQDSGAADERAISLIGLETSCEQPTAIEAMRDDIMGLHNRIMPVKFQYKSAYNGYYRVTDVSVGVDKWFNGSTVFQWTMSLQYLGPENIVDLESRLANVVRANDFGLTGERWHAPPIGHYGYYTGPTASSQMVRQSTDGALTVYRGVPAGINPRWGCLVSNYPLGRVRLFANGFERSSPGISMATTGWELNNTLVRVTPAVSGIASLLVAFWDGTAWREKAWDVRVGGDTVVPATHWDAITVMRLDPEMITLRVVARQPSNGARVLLDLSLRRGSRFVEGYVQRTSAGGVSVQLDVLEAWTDNTSYSSATGEDVDGIRNAVGTARFFSLATNGGISLSSSTTLDFWIGAEVPRPSVGGSNPGFETGVAGSPWFPVNGSLTVRSDTPKYGTYYGRVTATTAGVNLQLDHSETGSVGAVGKQYTISGWIRSPVSVAAGQSRIALLWYNGGTLLSTTSVAAPALVANVWTPVSGPGTAPASTTLIGRRAQLDAAAVSVGSVLDVDSLNVREAIDSGDTAASLQNQYIGAMAEKVGVVRR